MSDPDTTDNPSIPASSKPSLYMHPGTSDVIVTGKVQTQLDDDQKRDYAARKIQKVYRGYRTRRELKGWSLDPTMRWLEAVQEAKWYRSTQVQRPAGGNQDILQEEVEDSEEESTSQPGTEGGLSSEVRRKWRRVGQVALRAGGDDNIGDKMAENTIVSSETKLSKSSSGRNTKTRQEVRRRSIFDHEKTAKMMDLQYFLEMVDVKHRYGSSLRQYHNVWKNSPSRQNFFYWLDYGEGKDFELEQVPRDRLEREQVRYLTREERLDYLVSVDDAGRFRWAKNGERVWTDSERFRDSIKGVVPVEDKTPTFRKYNTEGVEVISESGSSSSDSGESSDEEVKRYLNQDFNEAKGVKKLAYVSPAVIYNHLMQKSLKKRDKWIFVADTSFRMYIGIKASGAFQHSSFLRGARISAAGLIKIKDGQLRSLSPLSGHYRPPAANFRAFVHALEDQGVDMSRVSISRSYAVLVGIEGYMKVKRKKKNVKEKIYEEKTKIMQKTEANSQEDTNHNDIPEGFQSRSIRKKETMSSDARPDAEKKEEEEKSGGHLSRLAKTITNRGLEADGIESETLGIRGRGIPGTAPEEGVPPPEGKR